MQQLHLQTKKIIQNFVKTVRKIYEQNLHIVRGRSGKSHWLPYKKNHLQGISPHIGAVTHNSKESCLNLKITSCWQNMLLHTPVKKFIKINKDLQV